MQRIVLVVELGDHRRRGAGLVRAWTEAYAEVSIGTSRILTNLAVDLVGTGYVKPLNRAIRDTADVLRRSSDILEKAYQAE